MKTEQTLPQRTVEPVITFLHEGASSTNGATVNEIIMHTGLSKSTVYRIIRQKHLYGIKENRGSPANTYYVKAEEAVRGLAILAERDFHRTEVARVIKNTIIQAINGIFEDSGVRKIQHLGKTLAMQPTAKSMDELVNSTRAALDKRDYTSLSLLGITLAVHAQAFKRNAIRKYGSRL